MKIDPEIRWESFAFGRDLIILVRFTPQAMKAFIEANFKMIDIDGDGVVGVNEFRYNCIQRLATDDIKVVDEAYNQLVNVSKVPNAVA